MYRDENETPRVLLSRILIFLRVHPDHPDEGMFLCNDGTIDEEFFVFLKPL